MSTSIMACKRKIYSEYPWKRDKKHEKGHLFKTQVSKDEISKTATDSENGIKENSDNKSDENGDILHSCEHRNNFAKIKSYFVALSTRISPSKFPALSKNSTNSTSKSCEDLLSHGNGFSSGKDAKNGGHSSNGKSVLSRECSFLTKPWLKRSKPITLRIRKPKIWWVKGFLVIEGVS